MNNNGNILLNQIIADNSLYSFKEVIPTHIHSDYNQQLTIDKAGNIFWASIDLSLNILVNNRLKDTDIYYDQGRVGIGRKPLYNYRMDLAIPKDKLMTAFHIGDGSFGFSFGNGANQGFIPEIIGIGSDDNDAGLYFVGIAGNDNASDTPLIIFDSRNTYGKRLINRPILGITSGDYSNYVILVDASNNLNIDGNVIANDIKLNNESLLEIIKDLQKQINNLQTKIT